MIQIDNKLLVKLPEGAKNKRILDMSYNSVHTKPTLFWDIGNFSDNKILPPGSWEIVGETKSITEEQARLIVENIPFKNTNEEGVVFPDYTEEKLEFAGKKFWNFTFKTSLESFHSWMEANKVPLENNYLILIKK